MYNRTQQQFGRAAEAYSKSKLFAQGEDLAWLVEAAAPQPDEVALDIGTAAGHTAFALAPYVRAVTGLDITPAMIETARANARERGLANFTGVVANAELLPFADASFDIVACRMTAHHFMQPELVMAEIARVLRPGGRTPPDRLAKLKGLFADAGPGLREQFAIQEPNFGLPAGLMRGTR